MIPLDRNESYWLLDDKLLNACKQYDSSTLSTYPRYEELKQKVAKYAGVSADQIALTPGSDAAIQEIARLYVGNGRTALLPVPTFYGYESVLARVDAKVIPVFYTEEDGRFEFPIEETCSILESEKPEALFLCNPNNPLGWSIPEEMIERVLNLTAQTGTRLILDEAYYEYSGQTMLDRIPRNPHLIVLRTFSKAFGIPGARIGYAIAASEIITELERKLLPWPVAHHSIVVAMTLLSHVAKVKERRDAVIREREEFAEELSKLPNVMVYPSETNFLLVKVPDAEVAQSNLSFAGIRVARGETMSQYSEAKVLLRNTLRMAIPAPEDASQVLAALRGNSQI